MIIVILAICINVLNRCDQYRRVHKGVYNVQLDGCGAINEKSNGVNGKFCNPPKKVMHSFVWGFNDLFILHSLVITQFMSIMNTKF